MRELTLGIRKSKLRKEYVKIQDDIKPCTMPQEKISAFLEEFPWIRRHISGPINQVYVSRITPELLSKHPCKDEEIYVIGEDGSCFSLGKETRREIQRGIFVNTLTLKRRHIYIVSGQETIGSVLHSLELQQGPPVRFLLSYLYHRYSIEDPASVIVYKPPQGLSVLEWVRQVINVEKEKLRQECAAIDSEARAS